MSKSLMFRIEMLSYWHIDSGVGRGADVDALTLKTTNGLPKGHVGLPYLPGRALKGLFRDAMLSCEDVGWLKKDTADTLCGTPTSDGRYDGSTPGILSFDNARLAEDEYSWLAFSPEGKEASAALYERYSSTKLNDFGVAVDKTLRTIELCIPVTLVALITGPDAGKWDESLSTAAGLIRALGSHRNRGIGRCRISLEASA